METVVAVILVVAFIGFIAWRVKKSNSEVAQGGGDLGDGTGSGGGPVGENNDTQLK